MTQQQLDICNRYGAEFLAADAGLKLGAAANLRAPLQPVNGLRLQPEDGTTGWFLWAGEDWSDADDFFLPLHVAHLDAWRPGLSQFLGLAPGWRFLVAPGWVDVWFDPELVTAATAVAGLGPGKSSKRTR